MEQLQSLLKEREFFFLFLVTFFLSLPSPFLKLPSNTYGPLKKTNWINLNFASNAGFTSLCGSRSRRDNKKIKKTSNFSKGPVHLWPFCQKKTWPLNQRLSVPEATRGQFFKQLLSVRFFLLLCFFFDKKITWPDASPWPCYHTTPIYRYTLLDSSYLVSRFHPWLYCSDHERSAYKINKVQKEDWAARLYGKSFMGLSFRIDQSFLLVSSFWKLASLQRVCLVANHEAKIESAPV